MTANGYRMSFGGDENVLKLIVATVTQPSKYTKTHCTVCFEWVNWMLGELYLNKKAVIKNTPSYISHYD